MSRFKKEAFKCPKCGTENMVNVNPSDKEVKIICKNCGETFMATDDNHIKDEEEVIKPREEAPKIDVCNNIFIDPDYKFVTNIMENKMGPVTVYRFSIIYSQLSLTLYLTHLQDLIHIKNQLIDAKLKNQLYTLYGIPQELADSSYYSEVTKENGMWSGIVHVLYQYSYC